MRAVDSLDPAPGRRVRAGQVLEEGDLPVTEVQNRVPNRYAEPFTVQLGAGGPNGFVDGLGGKPVREGFG